MAALPSLPELERGALVRWTSQSRGVTRTHAGVVVCVVPGGVHLATVIDRMRARYSLRAMHRVASPRPEKSYLVAQVDPGRRGKCRLHWPHASLLKPYEQDE